MIGQVDSADALPSFRCGGFALGASQAGAQPPPRNRTAELRKDKADEQEPELEKDWNGHGERMD
jgi:hypothetical protein